jgi:hypothetical protein
MDLVVTLQVEPDFGQTTGSAWMSALNSVSAGLNRTTATPIRQTYEFKAEFLDLKLFRDGEFIEPITPGRAITSQAIDSSLFNFVDEAYSGMYSYAPEVFMSGKEFRLEVYDAREPGRVHRTITLTPSHPLIKQIVSDFEAAIAEG